MTLISRRKWIGASVATTALGSILLRMSDGADADANLGQVVGDPEAPRVGGDVLRNGGNAIDAIVAGSFAAAVTSLGHTGIGGYGGSATIAIEGGRKVLSLDFNSTAPLTAGGLSVLQAIRTLQAMRHLAIPMLLVRANVLCTTWYPALSLITDKRFWRSEVEVAARFPTQYLLS